MKLKRMMSVVTFLAFLAPMAVIGATNAEKVSDAERDLFIENVDNQIDRMEDRVSELKKIRDAQSRSSSIRTQYEEKIHAMEAKMKETKDNMVALKKAPTSAWKTYEARVNQNLSQLRTLSENKIAE